MCLADADPKLQEIYNTYQAEIGKAADLIKSEGFESVYLAVPLTQEWGYLTDFSMGTKGVPGIKYYRLWQAIENEVGTLIDFFDYEDDVKYHDMLLSTGRLIEIA